MKHQAIPLAHCKKLKGKQSLVFTCVTLRSLCGAAAEAAFFVLSFDLKSVIFLQPTISLMGN